MSDYSKLKSATNARTRDIGSNANKGIYQINNGGKQIKTGNSSDHGRYGYDSNGNCRYSRNNNDKSSASKGNPPDWP